MLPCFPKRRARTADRQLPEMEDEVTDKDKQPKGVLVLVAEGFDEAEMVGIVAGLRQGGVLVKSVGLISGPIGGAHGVLIMPDMTLTEVPRMLDVASIHLVVLPAGDRHLVSLEPDPRVHRLLRQVIEQNGWVATNARGLDVLRCAMQGELGPVDAHVTMRAAGQPVEAFVQHLRRLCL